MEYVNTSVRLPWIVFAELLYVNENLKAVLLSHIMKLCKRIRGSLSQSFLPRLVSMIPFAFRAAPDLISTRWMSALRLLELPAHTD
jgi:hypothetical protein